MCTATQFNWSHKIMWGENAYYGNVLNQTYRQVYIYTYTSVSGLYIMHLNLHNVSGLLLHMTMNPSSSIVIEECKFFSMQLWVPISAYFVKAKIWIHKSCVAIFINHLTSTTNESSNTVIEEPKLSFSAARSSILFCKIWIHR